MSPIVVTQQRPHMRVRYTAAGGGSLTRKPTVTTPTAPTPLRTFYVDASGGSDSNDGSIGTPFQTITKINSTRQAGDRFYVKGTLGGSVALCVGGSGNSGTSSDPIQIMVWPGQTATLANGGVDYYPIYALSMSYYWIEGVTLTPDSGAYRNTLVSGGSNWTFVNCTFNGKNTTVLGATDVKFYDCTFTGVCGQANGNTGDTINTQNGADRCWFVRCTFEQEAFHAIGTLGNVQESGSACADLYMFDNYFRNIRAGGIILAGYNTGAIIEWNLFEEGGTSPDGTYPPATREQLENQCPGTIIRFNTIINGGYRGLFMAAYVYGGLTQESKNCHVHNNVIYGHPSVGLYMKCSDTLDARVSLANNTFENNIVWGNGTASGTDEGNGWFGGHLYPVWVNMYDADPPWNTDSLAGNVFRNNVFGCSTSDTRMIFISKSEGSGNIGYTEADFETAFGASGANNINDTDPVFVSSSDFHLQASSPCIDAGYATSGVGYLGSAVDIGVYEYGGTD